VVPAGWCGRHGKHRHGSSLAALAASVVVSPSYSPPLAIWRRSVVWIVG
jgi:hypothetical protein